ncbi:MAG: LysM peptidoglycan-binding domain-containing protein [Deltaproteobacteria bacterium]|jgi:membrane-bound lytic murein transglycosylase D|nr:LysM peptidoglycan-binding domain-containing protein [Deltaproteobacteria bacterium]
MKNYGYNIVFITITFFGMVLGSLPAWAGSMDAEFPVYDSIRPNVNFWKKIYTEYSTTQGIIHDKNNLAIIYEVIDLKDRNRHGSRKINKQRIKKVKKKYRRILAKLAQGKAPSDSQEHRVAALFGSQAKPVDFQNAMRNLRCQVGQNDPFRQGIIRSGAYLAEMKQIFRDAGLPEDLVYLPHVESSFNPKAYSKFGAAGMWQFTRSTGKHYMTVSYAIDERRDPIISTRAAARLLKWNFKKFRNWPMAITAYNHGVSGMLRAKRRKGDYETIFKEYRSRIFKFASRNFYSEFLAAREIAHDYEKYFGKLILDAPVRTEEVALAGYGSLPEIARHLNLKLAELRDLNPALRIPVLKGQKFVPRGFPLKLPARDDRDWQQVMAELAPQIYKNDQKHSRIYTVRKGDTAGEIARNHGVKLNDLIAANNLDARATIHIDQNLRIPLPEDKPVRMAAAKTKGAAPARLAAAVQTKDAGPEANEQSKMAAIKQQNEKSEPRPDAPVAQIDEPGPQQPQGVSGPDFDTIESNRNLEAAFLQMRTQISTAVQKPQRPPDAILNADIVQGQLAIKRIKTVRGRSIGRIQVEVEETLGHYAEWLEVSAGEIRRLNGLRFGKPLRINQSIKIPLRRVTKEDFEEKRFEFHKELAEDFFASFRVEKVETYTVRRGDSIWTISKEKFDVPLWLIKKYNAHLDFSELQPAQQLNIPIIEKNQV